MGFVSFVGRVLFASVFILSAYQEFSEFGVDGGPAARAIGPKFDVATKHFKNYVGVQVPHFEMKPLIATTIAMRGLGGVLFIFGSSFGACLLMIYLEVITPFIFDFYNYDSDKPEFAQLFAKFTENLALFGALLFFLGTRSSVSPKRHSKKKAPKTKTQ